MKCPVCDYITSPEKDLCGRCFSDLRQKKAELGFKILHPDLSYEQLLATKVRIVTKDSSSKKRHSTKEKLSKQTGSGFFSRIKNLIKKPVVQAEDSAGETLIEQEMQSDSSQSLMTAEPEVAGNKDRKLRLAKRQKEQMLGLLRRAQDKQEKLSAQQQSEKIKSIDITKLRELDAKTESLFLQVAQQLPADFQPSGVIAGDQLLNLNNAASFQALFELVAADLAEPESKRRFVDPLSRTKVENLESADLEKAVLRYENEDQDYQKKLALSALNISRGIEGQQASLSVRFRAWLIDSAISLLLAVFSALAIEFASSNLFSAMLLGEIDFSVADLYSVLIKVFLLFVLFKYIIISFYRALFGRTPAESYLGIVLVNERDMKAGWFLSILWGLSEVLVLFSFGLFEILKGSILSKQRICSARILRT